MSVRQWAVLVATAGIDIRVLDSMEVFLLAGKILRDPELDKCVRKHIHSVAPKGLREEILVSWSEAERAALRERISGVLPMRPKHA